MAWQDNMTPLQVGDVMHGNGPQRGRRRCRIAEKLEREGVNMSDELTREEHDGIPRHVACGCVVCEVRRLRAERHRASAAQIAELERDRNQYRAEAEGQRVDIRKLEDASMHGAFAGMGALVSNGRLRGEVAALREGLQDIDRQCEPHVGSAREPTLAQEIARVALSSDAGKPEADVIAAAQKVKIEDEAYRKALAEGNVIAFVMERRVLALGELCEAVERMNERK